MSCRGFLSPQALTPAVLGRRLFVTVRIAARVSLFAFAEALDKANGRANVVELGAQLVFEESLVAKVQRLFLVGENEERRRRDFCLRPVVDAHRTSLRRGPALQVDFILEPIVEDRRRDAAAARFAPFIDDRKKFVRALTSFRGEKND